MDVNIISIHTSAREVTQRHWQVSPILFYFNPHFRKGSDDNNGAILLFGFVFQSTLPQGK